MIVLVVQFTLITAKVILCVICAVVGMVDKIMNNCSLNLDWKKIIDKDSNKNKPDKMEKEPNFLKENNSSHSPPVLSPSTSLNDLIRHFLETDILTRENDLYLIFKVCERIGYCKHLRGFNGHYSFTFSEQDIVGGRIPRSFMDTVRRTRQKLQQNNPGLRPSVDIQMGRKARETIFRGLMKYGDAL